MYAVGSHVCPGCLHEDGHWQLRWKIPWSFACTRHQALLLSHCEGCSRRTQSGRQDGSTVPPLSTVVPDIRICHNPQAAGVATSGRKEVCGLNLTAMHAERLARFPAVLAAQRTIDDHLVGPPAADHLEFFSSMRSLVAVLLASSDRGQLGPLPGTVEEAWVTHERDREMVASRRARRRGQPGGYSGDTRQIFWRRVPVCSRLMAAVVPAALTILTDPERLVGVAITARKTRPHQAAHFASWFHMPPEYAAIWERSLDATRPRLSDRLSGVQTAVVSDTRLIPRLWPEWLHERDVSPLLRGVKLTSTTVRAYVSLLAARHALGCTWKDAAKALGYPDTLPRRRIAGLVNGVGRQLRLAARDGEFVGAAPRILGAIHELAPIDYRERERQFQHWDGFTPEEWLDIAIVAGIQPGRGRDRYAAGWLWAQLTGLDWRTAPVFGGQATRSHGMGFSRFSKELLPILRQHLIAHGDRLLEISSDPTLRITATPSEPARGPRGRGLRSKESLLRPGEQEASASAPFSPAASHGNQSRDGHRPRR